ncbi:hypothetical protein [uncultured Nonlabens sp.]|uniref:esterase/lipase family protein n=1 Tax=uncultured Nonlabens sp. TaxID=859306 RepID=UPI0026286E07|nr:hypothetical protein [uncultured Nonlabens sp.]
MKRIILSIGIALSLCNATAQNQEKTLDDALVNVNQTGVTSGIIYERTLQLANLYNFNREEGFDTANYDYFKQALLEMHRASNDNLFVSSSVLKDQIKVESDNIVPLGILNTDFQLLNHHVDDEQNGGLLYNEDTQEFSQINGQPPFYTLHTTVIAPLDKAAVGTGITYKIDSAYFFQNQQQRIKTLTADFGDGTSRSLISNFNLTAQQITVNYSTDGEKIAVYNIVYEDNTTITTKSKIYFKYEPTVVPKTLSPVCAGATFKENGRIVADIPFQGYNINDPNIFAEIDYRIFYSENDGGNNQLDNPIIILDGFDPGDKRKIEDCDCGQDEDCASDNAENGQFNPALHDSMFDFQFYESENGQDKNALTTLREEGYDVIMVNHPTYPTTDQNTGQEVEIDGGAYYIESNAMALIKLIQQTRDIAKGFNPNATLKLVGPSMGGQISRYALAYMEQKEEETGDDIWDHNVSHWVSIDSPHLGANIPLGDQALIYLLRDFSPEAADFYDLQLGSPAAQQQLIESHSQAPGLSHHHVDQTRLDGHTVLQGFSQDRGSNFFQTHYNNQSINGVANSQGFPIKSKNLSIINGSLSGSKMTDLQTQTGNLDFADDGERVLNIKTFARVKINLPIGNIVFRTHVATLDSHFMPTYTESRLAKFYKLPENKTIKSPNLNDRGVMDNVPGGYFGAQDDIAVAVNEGEPPVDIRHIPLGYTALHFALAQFHIFGADVSTDTQVRKLNPIHSFIPSFSAIAHLEPDQNWNNPLDYNLACESNKLTPFDTYFGQELNTRHTSFSQESIDWLLGNLALNDGSVLDPVYPITSPSFFTSNSICVDEVIRIGFENECKLVTDPTFITSSNIRVVSSNGHSAEIKGLQDGWGHIQVNVGNGQSFYREIYVGVPIMGDNVRILNYDIPALSIQPSSFEYCEQVSIQFDIDAPSFIEYAEVEMRKSPQSQAYWDGDYRSGKDRRVAIFPQCDELFVFEARARNACGWSDWKEYSVDLNVCDGDCTTTANPPGNDMSDNFIISPVPADTDITISFNVNPTWTFTPTNCYDYLTTVEGDPICDYYVVIEMFDLTDLRQIFIKGHKIGTSFDVSGLIPGTYVLKITHQGQIESHHIIVH